MIGVYGEGVRLRAFSADILCFFCEENEKKTKRIMICPKGIDKTLTSVLKYYQSHGAIKERIHENEYEKNSLRITCLHYRRCVRFRTRGLRLQQQ